MPFVSFPGLNALTSFRYMLNRTGKSGHPCLVSDIKGEITQSFTIEYDVSCKFFIKVASMVLA